MTATSDKATVTENLEEEVKKEALGEESSQKPQGFSWTLNPNLLTL